MFCYQGYKLIWYDHIRDTDITPNVNSIGRVRKNSGGKRQAYYQPQVSTGKRQVGRLMVLGGCTQRSETSGDSTGHQAVCAPTQNHQPIRSEVPVLTCAGDRPALFPPLFFAPSILGFPIEHRPTNMSKSINKYD